MLCRAHILNEQNLWHFLKLKKHEIVGVHLYTKLLEIIRQTIRQEKALKGKQMGQKEVNLSLLICYVILYITKFKDSIKRLLEMLEMVNKFCTKAGHKLNI
jgi:hypothetical protein